MNAAQKTPLAGIKVADFSGNATVPLATKVLGSYGAQVVKIEGRNRADLQRLSPPYKDGIAGVNRSGQFNEWNTSKLSVAVNLAHPKGVALAKRFVAWADFVVENFAGGVMERMGLGYEELKKIKPDTIMLSSCVYGQTGPYATLPGFGQHLTAASGFDHITGWPDREPIGVQFYTDFVAPHYNTVVLLAALDYRRRTGKGQYIDMSQYESGIHFVAPLALDYFVNKRVANRMGNRCDYAAPHGAYCCRGEDRWCAITAFTDEEWASLCRIIGNPAWTIDPRFTTLPARKENEEELDRLLAEWTINYPPEEVMTLMQGAGVAAGVLETGEDLMEHDPQLRHRGYFQEIDHPEMGKYFAQGPGFQLSKSPSELRPAPSLGEHNEYALRELLGMSDEEIAELVIEEVLE